MKRIRKFSIFCLTLAALTALFFLVSWRGFLKEKEISFAVTFSTLMARRLRLEPKETFDAILDDLNPKKMRIPIYWSEIEKERGIFEFSEYDFFIKKSEEAGAKLILIVGRKLPRWPECHIPSWAAREFSISNSQFPNNEFERLVDIYIQKVVERYKDSPAIVAWQLENEHFHKFGAECAANKLSSEIVDRELALIRSLDERPILLTDAGEGGWWGTSLKRSNFLGVTMYYQVWNPYWGVFWSPLGPGSYTLKKYFFEALYPGSKIIVAELQAEPFWNKLLPDYDLAIQKQLMSAERFQEIIRRSRRAGFSENYLWGAEWWFWLKEKQNDPSLWEEAKKLFSE